MSALHIYLGTPDQMDGAGQLQGTKTQQKLCFLWPAFHVQQSNGQKMQQSWPPCQASGAVMSKLLGSPEHICEAFSSLSGNVSHPADCGHAIALSWQHSSCDLCFAQKYKGVEASQSLRLVERRCCISAGRQKHAAPCGHIAPSPRGLQSGHWHCLCHHFGSLACSPPAQVRPTKTDCLLWKCESVFTSESRWWNKAY